MDFEDVQLRHPKAEGVEEDGDPSPIHRRPRPRSASYVALRSAVYQLTSLADFKLEKIGSGFFADVFKVKHKTTGEVLVLKMNKNSKTSKSMLSEIQLMNRLSHPNILRFKGSCVNEGHLHALTEYINGGSLEELLMDETVQLSWSVRLKIIKDIVNGMVYLHSKNVFHRDLNPKNCLIQREKDGKLRTVVADFGLAAKIKQRRRRSHTEAVGSPYWMAPECLKGKNYCEQADVFSFGIMLAEIIARIPADPDFMPRTKKFGLDMEAMRQLCSDCPEEFLELLDKCCQIDPDDRPTFEEVVEYLDTIHLSEDLEEGLKQLPTKPLLPSTPDTPHRDLRGCLSEPSIRLTDEDDIPDDDTRSCGSEGESRVIIDQSSRPHQRRLLDSLGSSTGSSYCDSVQEEGVLVENGMARSDIAGSTDSDDVIESSIATMGNGQSMCPQVEVSGIESDTDSSKAEKEEDGDNFTEWRRSNGLLFRRTSDGVLDESVGNRQRGLLQKSKSLNTESEGKVGDDDKPDGHPATSQQYPIIPLASRVPLYSSAQTLVAEDNVAPSNGTGRGGDSGIDPGDMEVFKFPPSTDDLSRDVSVTGILSSCDQGDNTPICTSPNLYSTEYATPITKGVAIKSRDQPVSNGDITYRSSPSHSQFSYSGTSSDDMTDFDRHNFTTPPNDQCVSPMTQSWTSSEFSFRLPTPSIPWAPPSSPLPSHSLPTSPTHYAHPTSSQRPHRRSCDVATSPNITSCLRKTRSSSRPHSCRNSALFPELNGDNSDFKKSVHFMDLDSYSNRDEINLTSVSLTRPRSKSTPHNTTMGKNLATFGGPEDRNYFGAEGGVIRLKSDWLNQDPHSCKCYKIAQQSNTRLSSSAPDLSKLMMPLLTISSPSPVVVPPRPQISLNGESKLCS